MLHNVLQPDVAKNPEELIVYGGTGRAARSWEALETIESSLRNLGEEDTLLVQSGKPVAIFKTHKDGAEGLDRQQYARAQMGYMGLLLRARTEGLDNVRTNDGWVLGLHRDSGDSPRNL